MTVLPLAFAAFLFFSMRGHRTIGALEELQPGMTLEEVSALFPTDWSFEEESANDFGGRMWVTDPEATPTRVLHVEPDEAEGLPSLWDRLILDRSVGVDVYFDGDGHFVGVQEPFPGKGRWRATWGTLLDQREGRPDGAGD